MEIISTSIFNLLSMTGKTARSMRNKSAPRARLICSMRSVLVVLDPTSLMLAPFEWAIWPRKPITSARFTRAALAGRRLVTKLAWSMLRQVEGFVGKLSS